MGKIKYYKVILKTVGPLFIGCGEKLEKSEYVMDVDTGIISVMDTIKMFNGLKELGLVKKYERAVMNSKDSMNLFSFFEENNLLRTYGEWVKYSYKVSDPKNMENTQISTFIKDPYLMPYVPGSSLKGALRNALLNYEIFSHVQSYSSIAREIPEEEFSKKYKNVYLSGLSNALEVKAGFNRPQRDKIKFSKFSGLRISDSKPLTLEDIVLCEKVDIFTNDNRAISRTLIQRECLKPGTTIEFNMEIDEGNPEAYVFGYDEKQLLKAVNLWYNRIKQNYLSAFPRVETSEGKNLIYVGGGSGYITKTALYSLYDNNEDAVKAASQVLHNLHPIRDKLHEGHKAHSNDYNNFGVSPHTRKCTFYNGERYDFGLCEIDFQPIG